MASHFLKQAYVPIFSKRKSTTFYTHTTKGCTTKKLPVVEVSCCALRPFHPPPFRFISLRDCDLCSCTPLSFCFSLPLNQHGFLSRFIARLSRYWIVQSILTTFVYSMYRCYVDVTEYLRVNQIPFVELFFLSFFFLVSFVRRDRCYFFHRVENGRSLGRLLKIF